MIGRTRFFDWILPVGFLLTVVFIGAGCGPGLVKESSSPLIDSPAAVEVLVEERRLEPPPSVAANRLLIGWSSVRGDGGPGWVPDADGATAEFVNVDARPRRLEILTSAAAPESEVVVTVAGRDLGAWPVVPKMTVDLPEDLPMGRVPLELVFRPPVIVNELVVRPLASKGTVEVIGDTVVQSPWSVVEITRRISSGARLVGDFVPPSKTPGKQQFEVVIEPVSSAENGAVRRWASTDGFSGPTHFEIPLADGLAAVRLVAKGRGGSAVWRGLEIIEADRDPPETTAGPKPPKLVVLYVLDALRADHVAGKGWTPVLDLMADEGASFSDYSSVAPSTMTSTKVLFTGKFFLTGGGLPSDVTTLAEVMSEAGYRTLGVSGNGHVSDKYGMTRGFDAFELVFPLARGADPATYVNRNAADIHRRGLELLDGSTPETPAFLYLHTIHPHTPYAPPHEMVREMCGGVDSSLDGMSPTVLSIRDGQTTISDADRDRLRCLYAASVAYNDARIGELVAELEKRFGRDEILFVVTSDHGEEFFDHGGVVHGHSLYDELLQVPLILWWPGRLAPSSVDLPSDTFDLHETLRTLVGAGLSSKDAEGRSLWPAIEPKNAVSLRWRLRHAAVPTLPGGIFMARSDRFKLVWAPRTGDGWGMGLGIGRGHDPEYFFDLEADPGETRNLVGSLTLEERWLRSRLRVWIDRNSGQGETEEVDLDEETREHLEALGYVE